MQTKMHSLAFVLVLSVILVCAAAGAADLNSASVPVCFVKNEGQADEEALFLAGAPGYSLYLTGDGQVLVPADPASGVQVTYPGSSPRAVTGEDILGGKANFFLGEDADSWITGVPMYSTVRYTDLYDGISLVYHGGNGLLKREFIVGPGSDPSLILMKYAGQEGLALDPSGALLIETAAGGLVETAPVCYQVVDGHEVTVSCSYLLGEEGAVRFTLGDYDPALPLVIDPVLDFSTYFGGNNEDKGVDIGIDDFGYVYIVGSTMSTNLPLANAPTYQEDLNGSYDIFVTKIMPDGSPPVYSTYIGGNSADLAGGIAVNNATGVITITGSTESLNYPVTILATRGGPKDAILTRLNADGDTLVFSRYINGNNTDVGTSVAIIPSSPDACVVVGYTDSDNFPATWGFTNTIGVATDAFIIPFDGAGLPTGGQRYLGGSDYDQANGVAVEPSSAAVWVTGSTKSLDFPTPITPVFRKLNSGKTDAFITELTWPGLGFANSTYLGGTENDVGTSIAVDLNGYPYITGYTESPVNPINLFPITPGTFQPSYAGGKYDAFITKMDADLRRLNYSTYLGGNFEDRGLDIAVDNMSNIFLAGFTISDNFPTKNPYQPNLGGLNSDAFVTVMNSTGKGLIYSTYLGGTYYDEAHGIAITPDGLNITVTGFTESVNFPIERPWQGYLAGFPPVRYNDAFITKIVRIPPVANFTSDRVSGCSPALICFNDTSTNSPTAWYWEFGDGTNSTEQNPCHLYYNNASHTAQNFTVNLTAWNSDGSGIVNRTNYTKVCPNLFWNLTANQTQGCLLNISSVNNATIQFNGVNVTGGDINLSSWYFDFGDNSTVIPTAFVHTYTEVGLYNVTLNVTNECCSNNTTIYGMVDIRTVPVADFFGIPTSGISPLSVNFFDNSSGRPSSWNYTFGAGQGSSILQNPTHIYPSKGHYRVNLTACNFCGCGEVTKDDYIRVDDPNLSFSAGTTLVLPNGTVVVPTNDTTPLFLFLEDAENGLSGYNLFIRFGDTITGDIASIQFPPWAYNQTIIGTLPAPNATIIASDLLNQVGPGASNILLATINLTGKLPGDMWFNVTVNSLDDDFGNPISTNSLPENLKIALLQPFPTKTSPPTDPFGDQKYWDVNGNGLIDFNDVVLYFQYTQITPWVQSGNEYLPFFDYNGNGLIDFNDLILLFQKV